MVPHMCISSHHFTPTGFVVEHWPRMPMAFSANACQPLWLCGCWSLRLWHSLVAFSGVYNDALHTSRRGGGGGCEAGPNTSKPSRGIPVTAVPMNAALSSPAACIPDECGPCCHWPPGAWAAGNYYSHVTRSYCSVRNLYLIGGQVHQP